MAAPLGSPCFAASLGTLRGGLGRDQSGSTSAASGQLLLADISGYTVVPAVRGPGPRDDAFADGAVPPAYAVLSNLLDGIIGRVVPPFTLSELEGDAVFAYATTSDPVPRGAAMLDCLTGCYADFRGGVGAGSRRLDSASAMPFRARITVLDLKLVISTQAPT